MAEPEDWKEAFLKCIVQLVTIIFFMLCFFFFSPLYLLGLFAGPIHSWETNQPYWKCPTLAGEGWHVDV